MRIVVDLDNTLCTNRKVDETYADVLPIEEMVNYIKKMKLEGHYIIIYTARNMVTQESNIGRVQANIGKITLDWLDNWDIPYDEIYFGKPYGDVYIDDKGIRPVEILELDKTHLKNEIAIKRYLKNKFNVGEFIRNLFY